MYTFKTRIKILIKYLNTYVFKYKLFPRKFIFQAMSDSLLIKNTRLIWNGVESPINYLKRAHLILLNDDNKKEYLFEHIDLLYVYMKNMNVKRYVIDTLKNWYENGLTSNFTFGHKHGDETSTYQVRYNIGIKKSKHKYSDIFPHFRYSDDDFC